MAKESKILPSNEHQSDTLSICADLSKPRDKQPDVGHWYSPKAVKSLIDEATQELKERFQLLEDYAKASKWYVEASKTELTEVGQTREMARQLMLEAEAALIEHGMNF